MPSLEALLIFATVYAGMVLGGLPRLGLDRTGVALLGAIAVIGFDLMTPEQAAASIHLPTLLMLFAFMVISAQMRLGGFYTAVTRQVVALPLGPAGLLAGVIAVAGGLVMDRVNDALGYGAGPRAALVVGVIAFALGALHAARWAAQRAPGLYDMQAVLGL